MAGKNIKIEIWTDLYYAKFIAIWRPEEEPDYVPLVPDPRPEQARNVPVLLIMDGMYEGRVEVVGANPVAPSQHPMPPDFMKRFVRHVAYCFANDFCTFQPPTKAAAETFLAKARVGYTLVKEMKATVSPAQGNISLKEFRDGLGAYTEEELKTIKVRTLGEHPDDAKAKNLGDYIHTMAGQSTPQYITVTKLLNVYDVADTTINNSQLDSGTVENGQPPGTLGAPVVQKQAALTNNAIASNTADATVMNSASKMNEEKGIVAGSAVTPVQKPVTKEEAQQQTIKDLQAKNPPAPIGGPTTVAPVGAPIPPAPPTI